MLLTGQRLRQCLGLVRIAGVERIVHAGKLVAQSADSFPLPVYAGGQVRTALEIDFIQLCLGLFQFAGKKCLPGAIQGFSRGNRTLQRAGACAQKLVRLSGKSPQKLQSGFSIACAYHPIDTRQNSPQSPDLR